MEWDWESIIVLTEFRRGFQFISERWCTSHLFPGFDVRPVDRASYPWLQSPTVFFLLPNSLWERILTLGLFLPPDSHLEARDEDVSLPYDRSPFPAGPVSFSFFTSFRLADSGHSNNFLSRHLWKVFTRAASFQLFLRLSRVGLHSVMLLVYLLLASFYGLILVLRSCSFHEEDLPLMMEQRLPRSPIAKPS